MKENMMIVGITAMDNEIIELKLEPAIQKKNKISFSTLQEKMMNGSDIKSIIKETSQGLTQRSKIYVSRELYHKNKITLFQYIEIELTPEKLD